MWSPNIKGDKKALSPSFATKLTNKETVVSWGRAFCRLFCRKNLRHSLFVCHQTLFLASIAHEILKYKLHTYRMWRVDFLSLQALSMRQPSIVPIGLPRDSVASGFWKVKLAPWLIVFYLPEEFIQIIELISVMCFGWV